jgi:DNA-binding response OmpR family regulator
MPRENAHGIAVARMARQREKKLPVPFMTAYPEAIEENRGLGKVRIKALRKPLPLDQLTDEMRFPLHRQRLRLSRTARIRSS